MSVKKSNAPAHPQGKTTEAGPVPALILSGGGARGLFQIGVMEELSKTDDPRIWPPKILSGTSSGAVNAAFYATGHSSQQIIEFWLEVGRDAPVQLDERLVRWVTKHALLFIYHNLTSSVGEKARTIKNIACFLRKKRTWRLVDLLVLAAEHIPTKQIASLEAFVESIESESLFTSGPLRRKLIHAFGGEELPAMSQTVILNAMDKHTKELVRLCNHKLTPQKPGYIFNRHLHVDHLLSSCSIPVLFNSVFCEKRTLWDGLLLGNTAMAPAAAFGATHILPILSSPQGNPYERNSFGGSLNQVLETIIENTYRMDRKLLHDRNEVARLTNQAKYRELELFEAIRPQEENLCSSLSFLNFSEDVILNFYEHGRQCAKQWLQAGAPLDLI